MQTQLDGGKGVLVRETAMWVISYVQYTCKLTKWRSQWSIHPSDLGIGKVDDEDSIFLTTMPSWVLWERWSPPLVYVFASAACVLLIVSRFKFIANEGADHVGKKTFWSEKHALSKIDTVLSASGAVFAEISRHYFRIFWIYIYIYIYICVYIYIYMCVCVYRVFQKKCCHFGI